MGYVGVEDNPITVSVTTPDGKKDYNVENGWYSEDGSNYEVKAERTCATTDTGSFLRIAL